MTTAIDPALRASLLDAARAFNNGRYFEAHEELGDALDDVPDDFWDLSVGLIQIAVGYHKVTQQLWCGAAGMLQQGI
jgi:predicted metal-dependent hydrolase